MVFMTYVYLDSLQCFDDFCLQKKKTLTYKRICLFNQKFHGRNLLLPANLKETLDTSSFNGDVTLNCVKDVSGQGQCHYCQTKK